MLPRILKDFALFIDGKGYVGKVDEIMLPKLTIKTEEHQAGGMVTPREIPLGYEKLECEFTLSEYNPDLLSLWGLTSNLSIPITLRGSLESDTESVAMVVNLQGFFREIDLGTIKKDEKTQCKFIASIHYYKMAINGEDKIEIDTDNLKLIINGVDQFIERRKHLGV